MERPRFHFTPEAGWLNDPNGFAYFDGEYHLFYQYEPDSLLGTGAGKHWGHAVSADLVGWTDLPVALAPDELGAIWSGCAVVDWRDTSGFFGGSPGLVALFTHWREGVQAQSLAHSADRGRTWTKYAGNPVIVAPELRVFRDPKVCWHAATGRWIMVVTIGQRARFYTSPNLRDWQEVGEFGQGYGSQSGVWECPDLFPLPVDGASGRERWVLLISVNGPGGSTMEYFVGDFDGWTFTSDNPAATVLPFDFGRDCYAAITWADLPPDDGRRLAIGWMSNWRYAHDLPTAPWRGALTLPRELVLQERPEGTRLIQRPVAELRELRGQTRQWPVQTIAPETALNPALTGEGVEIVVTFGNVAAREFGLKVRAGGGRGATVGYDTARQSVFIERGEEDNAGLARFGGRSEAPLALDGGQLTLHLFIDRCSIELFADGGAVVLTDLFFPADHGAIAPYCAAGTVELLALTTYDLAPPG